MKKPNNRVSFLFFLLMFLAVTMISSVHAAGDEDFLGENIQESVLTKQFVEYDLKLIQDKKYLIPSWMKYNSVTNVCDSGTNDYKGYTKFLSEKKCVTSTKYSPGLNEFSKQFFETTLDGTAEIIEYIQEEDPIIEGEEGGDDMGIFDDIFSDDSIDVETGDDDDIFTDLFEGIDDGEEVESEGEEIAEDFGENNIEGEEEGSVESEGVQEETVLQLVGGTKVLKLSDSKDYSQEVQQALSLMLGDEDFTVVEEETEDEIEEVFEVEDEELVFGNISINKNVNSFIKGIFLSDVKDLLFATKVEIEEVKLSDTHLAYALNNFTRKKKVIDLKGHKILGFSGIDYYNEIVTTLFLDFSSDVSINSSRKIIAKDIADVSFSLSSYTNKNLHDSIRESFRKKLILDIQKLEKNYSDLHESGEKISNFLLKR